MCQMIFLSRKLIHSLIEASLLNPTCIPLVGQKNDLGVPPKPMMISPQNDSHLTWHRCLKRLPLPGWLQITPRMLRTMPWLAIQKSYTFQKPNHPPNLPIYHLFHPHGKHFSFLLVCFTAPPFFTSMLLSSTAPRWHQQRHPPRRC